MKIEIEDDLDLDKIAESGQCFRWKKIDEGKYLIPAFGRFVIAGLFDEDGKKPLELSCDEKEFDEIWKDYFDFGTSYTGIRKKIDASDLFLKNSAEAGKGIRILRQDPFETLISFIVSQRKNIPAIESAVERLSKTYGHVVGEYEGEEIYSFPTIVDLQKMHCPKYDSKDADEKKGMDVDEKFIKCPYKEKGFDSCGLGYRLPYIKKTVGEIDKEAEQFSAEAFSEIDGSIKSDQSTISDHKMESEQSAEVNKNIDKYLEYLQSLDDDSLREKLLSFHGVGIKVASCTMLFGFHRLNDFPIDVWMKRALAEHYPDGFPFDKYAPFNGVMQQYIFAYYRAMNK